jgi:murein DD-endopeptidase MepM/ murein hydrolase activator NlpD
MGYTAIGDIALEATHVVSNGETLFDVANIYNIDPMNLAKINHIERPFDVHDGQVLRLPTENFPARVDKNFSEKSKEEEASERKKKQLDDGFEALMATKGAAATVPPASGAAADLSKPKVTHTAVGRPIATPPTAASPATVKMILPVKGRVISKFGDTKDGIFNDGIDIKAPLGTPVNAAANGEVIYVGNKLEEFGNTVIIQHDDDVITSYAHLKDIKVKARQKVTSKDVIASVGQSGAVKEPMLHFEVMKNKNPVDPSKYF